MSVCASLPYVLLDMKFIHLLQMSTRTKGNDLYFVVKQSKVTVSLKHLFLNNSRFQSTSCISFHHRRVRLLRKGFSSTSHRFLRRSGLYGGQSMTKFWARNIAECRHDQLKQPQIITLSPQACTVGIQKVLAEGPKCRTRCGS